MMFAFVKCMIRDKYKTFLIFLLSSIGFLEMYIALYPTIKQQSAALTEMIKTFPPEMFKAMNMDVATFSFNNLESYLSTEYLSFLWPILAIILAIMFANYIIIRDIDSGSINMIASLPVSRTKIFMSRFLTGFCLLMLFSFLSIAIAVPLAFLHGLDFNLANYFIASLGLMLFVLAVYSLATFVSTLFTEKGKATITTSSILLVMYVVNVVANLSDKLENIKYFSFFHYFNGQDLLTKGDLKIQSIIVLLSLSLVFLVFAVLNLRKRDLSV